MQKCAYLVTVYLGFVMLYLSIVRRKEASRLLVTLNEMSQINMRKPNHLKYRPRRNLIYLVVLTIPMSTVILALVPLPILIETFRTGELFFKSSFSLGSPFSVVNYVQAAVHYLVFFYIYWFCMPFYGIILENFLQIVLNCSILADELRVLRKGKRVDEEVEYGKLRDSMTVFNDLKGCAKENDCEYLNS